jgi:holo-[acyl-carrier protein] synthase
MILDILGLGCDILEVNRLNLVLRTDKKAFIKRILTHAELMEYERRVEKSLIRGDLFIATRYCAKEAFSKAMGYGIGKQFSFQDLTILNDELGSPLFHYSEKLAMWINSKNAFAKISISDEKNYVMSTVILYSKKID